MSEGVTMHLPETIYIDDTATIGKDTVIWPGSVIRGKTKIGQGCQIGPNIHLNDITIEDGKQVN